MTKAPTKPAHKEVVKGAAREKMLREKVGLDEAKAKKVVALLETQKAARKPAREAIKAALGALRELVKANKADDAGYATAILKVQAARESLRVLEGTQQTEVAKLLTPREQARYLLAKGKSKKHDKPAAHPKPDPKAKTPAAPGAKDDKDDDDDDTNE